MCSDKSFVGKFVRGKRIHWIWSRVNENMQTYIQWRPCKEAIRTNQEILQKRFLFFVCSKRLSEIIKIIPKLKKVEELRSIEGVHVICAKGCSRVCHHGQTRAEVSISRRKQLFSFLQQKFLKTVQKINYRV